MWFLVVFLQKVDRLFDILNSRSVAGRGYKRPIWLSSLGVSHSVFTRHKDIFYEFENNGWYGDTPLYNTRWYYIFLLKLLLVLLFASFLFAMVEVDWNTNSNFGLNQNCTCNILVMIYCLVTWYSLLFFHNISVCFYD